MRLGIDLGTNSIGWCLYELGNEETVSSHIDAGVRIFSDGRDPKSGASLAVDRREARSARRRRDRYLRRRKALIKKLKECGLLPENRDEAKKLVGLDPYELRTKGLHEEIPLTHFGRALFHLNQRRGFKSNRKTDRGDNESGKIRDATARLDQEMLTVGAETLGEYLHMRLNKGADENHIPTVRARLKTIKKDDSEEEGYDFYPDRRHLEAEFDKLWATQSKYHESVLTEKLRKELFDIIFFQRPLKEQKVGLCRYMPEERLPRAHPLTQRRVLYETVNNLRITSDGRKSRPLSMDERNNVIYWLDNKKPTKSISSMKMTLEALGKNLRLSSDERFTLGSIARDSIACDPVRSSLIHPDRFGSNWSNLSDAEQEEIVTRIRKIESDKEYEELIHWLTDAHNLKETRAINVANAPLPEFFSPLGKTATKRILEELKREVITTSEAVKRCGWHHSNSRTGEILDQLPYYGEVLDRHVIPGTGDQKDDEIARFGRISNATVHIALNQLRRLVNRIITKYGKPDEIVVEVARDLKMSTKQKREYEKRANENKNAAIKRGLKLEELKIPNTGANRMLLRLHEELGETMPKLCPYSGKPISITMVFDGSCDVDHILPYSRTLDDSPSNLTLCLKEFNREKSNKTPWETWGDTDNWTTIEANLKNLTDKKRWRFSPDAMERYESDDRFLDRALVDTQYLSRVARAYLDTLYTEGGHVWVVPGQMTAMLRRHWGLDSLLSDKDNAAKEKNRTDHRHHAIDAAVVAATDRSLIMKISRAAGKKEVDGAEDVVNNSPEPWEGFRADLEKVINNIIVSHRPDHGKIDFQSKSSGLDTTTGQLHNETAYGIIDEENVVSRTPLLDLSKKEIEGTSRKKKIRDSKLQKALSDATKGVNDNQLKTELLKFANSPGPYYGIRRVRLIEKMTPASRVTINDNKGKSYKVYKGDSNYCYEIWQLPEGKIEALVVTTFEANNGIIQKPHPAAKKLIRLHKRDMVSIERDNETTICVVQRFSAVNGIYLAPHFEANTDARNRSDDDPFKLLFMSASTAIKSKIRRLIVDEIGRIRY